jgi:aspartate carbamoyltransferase catalytic subunit
MFTRPGTAVATEFPRHAISSESWSRSQLEALFARAEWMSGQSRHRLSELAPRLVVGLLFYQNSTRTRISFQSASGLLGSRHVGFTDAGTTRAGDFFQESLEDTVRVLGCYADLLVLRHTDDDAAARAAAVASVPVISAGTGECDHPTQGMLETWMMRRIFGTLSPLRVGVVGDPRCRALRSIVTMMAKFSPAEINLLSPGSIPLPAIQKAQLQAAGVRVRFSESAAELLRNVDVVSMIPLELPDFHLATSPARRTGAVPERFRFSRKVIEQHGRDVVVLHVGPRGDELPGDVDELANVRYFESVRAGVFLRAALIGSLWEMWGHDVSVPADAPRRSEPSEGKGRQSRHDG